MATLDVIICAVVCVGVLSGFVRGFFRQLASVAGVLVGLFAAQKGYLAVASLLSPSPIESVPFAKALSFVLIWLLVSLLIAWLALLLTKVVELLFLGCLNRLLGALLGAFKYTLVAGCLICLLDFADGENKLISREEKEESLLYYPVKSFAASLFPVAEEFARQYVFQ